MALKKDRSQCNESRTRSCKPGEPRPELDGSITPSMMKNNNVSNINNSNISPVRPDNDRIWGRSQSRNQARPLSSNRASRRSDRITTSVRPHTSSGMNRNYVNNPTVISDNTERSLVVRTPVNRRLQRPGKNCGRNGERRRNWNNRKRPVTASGPELARKRIQERYRKFLLKSMSR